MKESKQATALKRADGVDTVSNLPDPVLHLILSGLSTTEEIIRTSVLSRRWRYLWTSIPRVDIDYCRGENPEYQFTENKLKEHKFTEYVYWVLLNRTLDLDSVRLCCSYFYSMSTVGRWIHAAVTRNVKQLHLMFRPRNESTNEHEKIEMPHCLMTCCSLEVLRLFLMRGWLSLPNFKGFPSLRVLELNRVELLDAGIVKSFFKSCPLLEDLSLIECLIDELEFLCISSLKLKNLRIDNREVFEDEDMYVCGDLQIYCPKLVYLELSGPIAHNFSFDSLDSLKKAVVHPRFLESEDMDNTKCELFARIPHVEYLSISRTFALECIDPEVYVPVSIKTLELTMDRGSFMDVHQLGFIKKIPNLESLHLNIIGHIITQRCWKLNEAATVRIWTKQLKKVVFAEFNGAKWALELACFFLEHGKALEEMVFIWRDEALFNEMSTMTMNRVLYFYKVSSNVKLISLMTPSTQDSIYFSQV